MKRYTQDNFENIVEDENGEFVMFDDYAALRVVLQNLIWASENILIDEAESEDEDLDAFYACRVNARLAAGDGVIVTGRPSDRTEVGQ